MKENFFNVGYSVYLQKNKRRTSLNFIWKKICEHKIIVSVFLVIIICMAMNFWLIYKFMNILEVSSLIY